MIRRLDGKNKETRPRYISKKEEYTKTQKKLKYNGMEKKKIKNRERNEQKNIKKK